LNGEKTATLFASTRGSRCCELHIWVATASPYSAEAVLSRFARGMALEDTWAESASCLARSSASAFGTRTLGICNFASAPC